MSDAHVAAWMAFEAGATSPAIPVNGPSAMAPGGGASRWPWMCATARPEMPDPTMAIFL